MFMPMKCSIRKQWKGSQMIDIHEEFRFSVSESASVQVVQTSSCNLKIRDLFFDTEDL